MENMTDERETEKLVKDFLSAMEMDGEFLIDEMIEFPENYGE